MELAFTLGFRLEVMRNVNTLTANSGDWEQFHTRSSNGQWRESKRFIVEVRAVDGWVM